jgi:hypothetical protein
VEEAVEAEVAEEVEEAVEAVEVAEEAEEAVEAAEVAEEAEEAVEAAEVAEEAEEAVEAAEAAYEAEEAAEAVEEYDQVEVVNDDLDLEPQPIEMLPQPAPMPVPARASAPPRTLDSVLQSLPSQPSRPVPAPAPMPMMGTSNLSAEERKMMLLLYIGLYLLVFLAHTPHLAWIFTSQTFGNERMSASAPGWLLVQGKLFFWFTMVFAVVVLGVVSLRFLPLEPRLSADLFTGGITAAAGWGTATALWMLSAIIKTFVTAAKTKAPSEMKMTILPGLGLVFGLLAAIAVAGLFTLIVLRRRKQLWILIGHGSGAVIGLILFLCILPWKEWDAEAFQSGFMNMIE